MKKLLSLLAVSALVFSACGLGSEKDRYIDAVTEATCMIFGSGDINDPTLEEKTKAIFRDAGFEADNEEAMVALAKKYDGDDDVQTAIEEALDTCAGDFMNSLEDLNLDETLDDLSVEEEADVEPVTLDEASDEVPATE